MGKTLTAYFSATGTTAKLAATVAAAADADLFEILPAVNYTAEDLNWNNGNSRSSQEMKDSASRVEIAATVPNMADYDTILVGYPIWWGVAPHIINSFLESYDLTGKTILPFATSGGSGIGDPASYLGSSARGAVVKNGKRFSVTASVEEVKDWLRG